MKKIIALAIVAALSTAAQAEGFYVGTDVGQTRFKAEDTTFKSNGVNLYGGYLLNDNVSFEAGWRSLGSDTQFGDKLKGSALQASVLLSAPLSNSFSLFGRLGVSRVESKVTGPGLNEKDSETKGLVGFGARYAINKQIGLRAEFQKPHPDVKLISVGVDYRF
ncbi:porin family protein [Roseateles sp. DAIF2]|uniref:porin family protein n=1 Tax=Roseateles sp. DAIF2 TaxID=2714952 RepID=UPI0018A315CE|nr:porin family protein [Roseateles sp. DAIF2]QPF75549.1 porin family protein [Roseateles sp. DAIF2]